MKPKHSNILIELEDYLEKCDYIFLFCNDIKWFELCFSQSSILKSCKKRICIFSSSEMHYPEQIFHVHISMEEERAILEIYRLYEFSDRFFVIISNSKMYGSLFQYIKTGILNVEDVIKVLLR